LTKGQPIQQWGSEQRPEKKSKRKKITKIFGRPTKHDITKMEKELLAIAAGIPSN
jgi:hypothetical protein